MTDATTIEQDERKMSEWQPIETAPKDVSVIVYADGVVGEASCPDATDRWWWAQTDEHDSWARPIYPTHWRPLPEPPKP